MTKIIIETEETNQLVKEGGKLVFRPEAELAIMELLKLQEFIEKKLDEVKQMIADAGNAIDPSFKGVVGEQVKAIYRVFGEKYSYDENFLVALDNSKFLKKTERYKVDSKAIDEYFKKYGRLPEGISMKERAKVISLVPPKHEKDATELQPIELLDAGEE